MVEETPVVAPAVEPPSAIAQASEPTVEAAAEVKVAAAGTPEEIAAAKVVAEAATKAEAEGKTGAPEAYTDFTLPDGMDLDKVTMEAALPVFKELNLTQDQAQKLVGLQTASEEARVEAEAAQWEKTNDEWREKAKSDPEFGGANLQGNLSHIKTFLDKFATPEFRTSLDISGLGNQTEILTVFASIGKAMSEDTISVGTVVNPGKKSVEELFYGGTTQP